MKPSVLNYFNDFYPLRPGHVPAKQFNKNGWFIAISKSGCDAAWACPRCLTQWGTFNCPDWKGYCANCSGNGDKHVKAISGFMWYWSFRMMVYLFGYGLLQKIADESESDRQTKVRPISLEFAVKQMSDAVEKSLKNRAFLEKLTKRQQSK